MKAVERIRAKLRIWLAACLGFPKALSMMMESAKRRYWRRVGVSFEERSERWWRRKERGARDGELKPPRCRGC